MEYDKETVLDAKQLEFLDRMDQDMERGIRIHGELIKNPDNEQRVRFVSMNLVKALQQDNHAIVIASCAYLSERRPALMEVHANDHEHGVKFDFVDSLDS